MFDVAVGHVVVCGFAESGKSTVAAVLSSHLAESTPDPTPSATAAATAATAITEWDDGGLIPPEQRVAMQTDLQRRSPGRTVRVVGVVDVVHLAYAYVSGTHSHSHSESDSESDNENDGGENDSNENDESRAAGYGVPDDNDPRLVDVLALAAVADVLILTKIDVLGKNSPMLNVITALGELRGSAAGMYVLDFATKTLSPWDSDDPAITSSATAAAARVPYIPFREYNTDVVSLRFVLSAPVFDAGMDTEREEIRARAVVSRWLATFALDRAGQVFAVLAVLPSLAEPGAVWRVHAHGLHVVGLEHVRGSLDDPAGECVVKGWRLMSRSLSNAWSAARASGPGHAGDLRLAVGHGAATWKDAVADLFTYAWLAAAVAFAFAPRRALELIGLAPALATADAYTWGLSSTVLDAPGATILIGLFLLLLYHLVSIVTEVTLAHRRH